MADYSLMEAVKKVYELATIIDAISAPIGCSEWDRLRTNIRPGHVPSDGQVLNRADYPDMWAAILAGNVPVVSDVDWVADPYKRASFTTGDGSSTFRVPDENGKSAGAVGALFHRGDGVNSAGTNGLIQGDEIRNFKGEVTDCVVGASSSAGGVFRFTGSIQSPYDAQGNGLLKFGKLDLDLSRVLTTGPETRPVSATGCWVVKVIKSSKIAGLT